jgi:trimeric autotransporter adhesin
MGLFSTLLLNTTTSSSKSSVVEVVGTNTDGGVAVRSHTATPTTNGTTIIPSIVQLYMKRPIPILAIDTATVAIDLLENENYHTHNHKKQPRKFHTHTWLTTTTTANVSSNGSTAATATTTTTAAANGTDVVHGMATTAFAPLRYQAIQCIPIQESVGDPSIVSYLLSGGTAAFASSSSTSSSGPATTTTTTTGLRNQSKYLKDMATKWIQPDLGIWYCRCTSAATTTLSTPATITNTTTSSNSNSNSIRNIPSETNATTNNCSNMADALLPLTMLAAGGSSPPIVFCMVVDLSISNLPWVESNITTIQQTLVRLLIRHSHSFTNDPINNSNSSTASTATATATTSLYQLRMVQFGLANRDTKSPMSNTTTSTTTTTMTATTTSSDAAMLELDQNVRMTLQICVVVQNQSLLGNHPTNDGNATTTTSTSTSTSTNDDIDYKTQQHIQLLTYHLRKYAAALNASLVFVNTNDYDTTATTTTRTTASTAMDNVSMSLSTKETTTVRTNMTQPTVNVQELPLIWKAVASGHPIWQYDSMEAFESDRTIDVPSAIVSVPSDIVSDGPPSNPEDNVDVTTPAVVTMDGGSGTTQSHPNDNNSNNSNTEGGYSWMYGPDHQNSELIESVLLRNANYPGHWDATTDSVWKILIPSATVVVASNNSSKTFSQRVASTDHPMATHDGDQIWLKELHDSILPVMTPATTASSSSSSSSNLQTPPPNKNKTTNAPPSSTAKTPNDAAVSSFFEGLLK